MDCNKDVSKQDQVELVDLSAEKCAATVGCRGGGGEGAVVIRMLGVSFWLIEGSCCASWRR